MTDARIKPEELKKLVMMGKLRPMYYGFNPGSKEADLLLVDRKKPGEVLGRLAKREGEGSKISYGEFELEGRNITVRTPQYIQGLAKRLRKHFKSLGMSFGVEIQDENGEVLESDLAEADKGAADQAALTEEPALVEPEPEMAQTEPDVTEPLTPDAKAQEAAAQRSAMTDRVRALQAPVAALGPSGAQMKKAIAAVVALIKDGSFKTAQTALDRIEEALARAAPKQAEGAQDASAPEPQVLLARAGAVKAQLGGMQDADAEAVKKHLVQALELVKARDFAGAEAALLAAEAAVGEGVRKRTEAPAEATEKTAEEAVSAADVETDPGRQADPQAEKEAEANRVAQTEWETILAPLRAEVEAALQANVGDVATISLAFAAAQDQAAAGKYKEALKSAETLQRVLNEAADAPEAVPAVDAANTRTYEQLRGTWENTRNALLADLERLRLAIQAKAGAVDGLAKIAANADQLHGYLDALDGSLEQALAALVRSKDAKEEERLKQEALESVQAYRQALDSAFFQAVDRNGFTKTEIRGKALDTLSGVENALAA